MHRLAERLASIIEMRDEDLRFVHEERQVFTARVNPETGRMDRQPVAILGADQDILKRAFDHPEIDWRRFARCSNCQAFYYQPRLNSRSCGPKCDSALRQREHYWLEVGRREIVCKLRSENNSVTKIARVLGVKPERVRQYLAGGKTDGKTA